MSAAGNCSVHRFRSLRRALAALQLHFLAETATGLQQKGLTEYVNSKQGYRIDRPSFWEQTSKAGADVLFADPLQKSTTVGVTVNPIKIAGLEQFGNVQTVRKKLVDTEKQKVGISLEGSLCLCFLAVPLYVCDFAR